METTLLVLASFFFLSVAQAVTALPECPATTCHLACPSEWTTFAQSGFCYRVFFNMNWWDAENFCLGQGAHLASVHNEAENEFVANLASTYRDSTYSQMTWIGGFSTTKTNRDWAWTDGSKFDYNNWQDTQPDQIDENCIQVYSDDSNNKYDLVKTQWNNYQCKFAVRAFVCKRKPLA
ncbi:hypothetical protein L596_016113 [Steinernema carpocapsae]|uniref:C-type lectin domain-containing protein n=1 Tax=Steinernema carpocapsae TaxID=34508 RepID=A0A4U5NHU3_STECR|nr:hypothetical protein L596_016113 [Steinernema carpocapsae]